MDLRNGLFRLAVFAELRVTLAEANAARPTHSYHYLFQQRFRQTVSPSPNHFVFAIPFSPSITETPRHAYFVSASVLSSLSDIKSSPDEDERRTKKNCSKNAPSCIPQPPTTTTQHDTRHKMDAPAPSEFLTTPRDIHSITFHSDWSGEAGPERRREGSEAVRGRSQEVKEERKNSRYTLM